MEGYKPQDFSSFHRSEKLVQRRSASGRWRGTRIIRELKIYISTDDTDGCPQADGGGEREVIHTLSIKRGVHQAEASFGN